MRPLDTMVPVHWHSSTPAVHVLHPGDVSLAFEGDRLETLLGSCVAVLLADPRRTTAAMCHIVHSGRPAPSRTQDTAYAAAAMHALFGRMRSVGIAPQECDAWLFGGGHMFPADKRVMDVGGRNVQWAQAFLRSHQMQPQAQRVGGHSYRKVAWTVGPTPPEQAVAEMPICVQ